MKKDFYYYLIDKTGIIFLTLLILSGCKKDDGILPIVSTLEVTDVTYNSAICGGTIDLDGGSDITEKGVCCSTDSTPTTDDFRTRDGEGIEPFTSTLRNLTPNTKYYVRAYATNAAGTGYGVVRSFTPTEHAPIISTTPINMTYTGIKGGGYVISNGGYEISTRGICWSTEPDPTILDNYEASGSGDGEFIVNAHYFEYNTKYYLKAYATNSLGTGYGEEITFTIWMGAPGPNITDADSNTYHTVKIGTQIWMVENLRTKKYSNGDPISTTSPAGLDIQNQDSAKYQWAYNGNESLVDDYGRLYTWATVMDNRKLSPTGWHIPRNAEWRILADFFGGDQYAAEYLRDISTFWTSTSDSHNSSGFAARGGGMRSQNGEFYQLKQRGHWWSTDQWEQDPQHGIGRYMITDNYSCNESNYPMNSGLSVRCIKDN